MEDAAPGKKEGGTAGPPSHPLRPLSRERPHRCYAFRRPAVARWRASIDGVALFSSAEAVGDSVVAAALAVERIVGADAVKGPVSRSFEP